VDQSEIYSANHIPTSVGLEWGFHVPYTSSGLQVCARTTV
jgi:hypothetical protein